MLFWFEGVKIVQYYDNAIMILYDFGTNNVPIAIGITNLRIVNLLF